MSAIQKSLARLDSWLVGLEAVELAGRARRRKFIEPQAAVFGADGLFRGQVFVGGDLFSQLVLLNASRVASGFGGPLGILADWSVEALGHVIIVTNSNGLRPQV